MKSHENKTSVWKLLLGLLLSLSGAAALAGPVNCGNKPFTLGFTGYGLLYYEEDGRGKGINKDFVDELIKRTGCKIDAQVVPWARIWADLASGDLDMTVAGAPTPERERFAWFAPYGILKNYVVIRADAASNVRNAEEFFRQRELQFGVVRGFKHGEEQDKWLEKMGQAQRVQESPTVEVLFEKLMLGRIEAIFSQIPVYRKQFRSLNLEGTVVIQDWTPGDKGLIGSLVLAKRRFSDAEAARWQAVVREMHHDGTLEHIFVRYMSPTEAKSTADF